MSRNWAGLKGRVSRRRAT